MRSNDYQEEESAEVFCFSDFSCSSENTLKVSLGVQNIKIQNKINVDSMAQMLQSCKKFMRNNNNK